ncbi:hypothetical protein [Pacificibacter marinus]|uniref:hypothetical protein n=1 Tax=Pacificibacter marinus TaxID=658057 RepID=UPI003F53FBCB
MMQLAPATVVNADSLAPDMMTVVSRMNEMKHSEGIEEKIKRQYESFVGFFTSPTDISHVRLVRQADAIKYLKLYLFNFFEPVTLSCRPKCSFKPLSFRKRRGFSSPVLSGGGADLRGH